VFGDRLEQRDPALRDKPGVAVNRPERPLGAERFIGDPLLRQKAAIEPEQRRRRSAVRGKVLSAPHASIPKSTHVVFFDPCAVTADLANARTSPGRCCDSGARFSHFGTVTAS
jgi:hypothetical protein